MSNYEVWLPKIVPGWLRKLTGRRFFKGTGRHMDQIVAALEDAGDVQFPLSAPTDALPYIAEERGLPRGPAEAVGAHRTRLNDAWNRWGGDNTPSTGKGGGGGTHLGLLKELVVAGLPGDDDGTIIVQHNGYYAHLDAAGELVFGQSTVLMDCIHRRDLTGVVNARPGWVFDGRHNFYSMFGLVIAQDVVIDSNVVNAIVAKWRPADALFVGTWVVNDGLLLGWPAGSRTLGTEPDLGDNVRTFYPGLDHRRINYYP